MLTTNVDVSDRLINDQLGYIYDFATNIGTVAKIHVKLDNNAAGLKAIQNESLERTHNAVPISRKKASFACQKHIHLQSNELSFLLCWYMTVPCAKFKVLL